MVLEGHVPGSVARRGVVLVAAALLLVGCSGGATPSPVVSPSQAASGGAATSVATALSEFKIGLAATSAPAGPVTFKLTNGGAVVHEFVVFKTDLAADKLPMEASGAAVDEAAAGLTVVDEVEDIAVGATPSLTVNLPAGRYLLLCNVDTHYKAGMVAEFTTN